MLEKISISNFAIIEDMTIEFDKGMTSLTGQTGAGKSLIIDSINLLLGSRADSDLIRHNENKAIITGVFSELNDAAKSFLNNIGIDAEKITIVREISNTSKNNVKINNISISLSQLKAFGFFLADIHVQHDTFRLINPENYLSLLDKFGDEKLIVAYNNYQISYNNYRTVLKKYRELSSKNKILNEKIDYLKYQYEEISSFDLSVQMYNDLTEQITKMSNYDKIFSNLNLAYEALLNVDNIYECGNYLGHISEIDGLYKKYSTDLQGFYYEIEDIRGEIKKQIDNMDFDQEALNIAIEKQNSINNLLKKYKMNLEELISYSEEIKESIMLSENYDEYLEEHYKAVLKAFDDLKNKAQELTEKRQGVAKKLSKTLKSECYDLELEKMNFEIVFNSVDVKDCLDDSNINSTGFDNIDFLISLNQGEPLKPLNKVASGGEMSRIMLALKKIFAEIQNLSLIVFDEIDSGISGEAAAKMAKKIKEISLNAQVLCITHLPHVASIADNHIHIYKDFVDNKTKTGIIKLSDEQRVMEIAHMISGNKISNFAIAHAKELLNIK